MVFHIYLLCVKAEFYVEQNAQTQISVNVHCDSDTEITITEYV